MSKPINSRYPEDSWRDAPRARATLSCGPGLTKQSFKDECDVNFIMDKWKRTGIIPAESVGKMRPSYGDFTNPNDYMEACNRVLDANEAFASLPAFLRDRFANEPANLIAFLADSNNQDEAIKLGLAQAPIPEGEKPVIEDVPKSKIPENPTPIEGGE